QHLHLRRGRRLQRHVRLRSVRAASDLRQLESLAAGLHLHPGHALRQGDARDREDRPGDDPRARALKQVRPCANIRGVLPPPPLTPPAPAAVPLGARLRASFSQSGRTLRLVWRSSPGGTLALGVLTVVAAALPPLVAWVGKLIIDAVMAAHAA